MRENCECGDFQLSLLVSSTHNLVVPTDILVWSAVGITNLMGSMYQRVSLETRTAAAASLGYYLLYLLSLFVTIVSWLVLCVCSTVLSEFLCPLPRPHRFVIAGIVCHTCLSMRTILCKFITVERRVLNMAASLQISAMQKQSAASERRSQHDDVRRPSLEATTVSRSQLRHLHHDFYHLRTVSSSATDDRHIYLTFV